MNSPPMPQVPGRLPGKRYLTTNKNKVARKEYIDKRDADNIKSLEGYLDIYELLLKTNKTTLSMIREAIAQSEKNYSEFLKFEPIRLKFMKDNHITRDFYFALGSEEQKRQNLQRNANLKNANDTYAQGLLEMEREKKELEDDLHEMRRNEAYMIALIAHYETRIEQFKNALETKDSLEIRALIEAVSRDPRDKYFEELTNDDMNPKFNTNIGAIRNEIAAEDKLTPNEHIAFLTAKQNALKSKEDKTACKSLQKTYEEEIKEQKHYNDNPNIYKGVKRPFAYGPPPPECDKYLKPTNANTSRNLRRHKNRTRKHRK